MPSDHPLRPIREITPPSLDPWLSEHRESVFRRGIKYLPRGRRLDFLYGAYNELVTPGGTLPAEFEIGVKYWHPVEGADVEESCHIDLLDYWHSTHMRGDTERVGERIGQAVETVAKEVKQIAGRVEALPLLANPTGLRLSVSTLRDLRQILTDGDIEKLEPLAGDYGALREVLKIEPGVAFRIWNFFRGYSNGKALEEIEGVTPDVLAALRRHFVVPE